MTLSEQGDDWLHNAIETVGEVISFWGFKENHGKIWALLYLNNRPFGTSEIRDFLHLSKGAASMLLQDLEDWNVICRQDWPNERERFYIANDDFITMIALVLERRESDIIDRSMLKLHQIQDSAEKGNADIEQVQAISKMISLAKLMKQILNMGRKMQNRNIDELAQLLEGLNKIL